MLGGAPKQTKKDLSVARLLFVQYKEEESHLCETYSELRAVSKAAFVAGNIEEKRQLDLEAR